MIQIREEQWVSFDSVESVFVREGDLQIVPNRMGGDEALPYLVENGYLEDVCGALQLPYGAIHGVIIRQLQEKERGNSSRKESTAVRPT